MSDSPATATSEPPPKKRWFWKSVGFLLRWSLYLLCSLWAFGAVYFDGPGNRDENLFLAISWAAVTLTFLLFLRGRLRRAFIWLLCFAAVLGPWLLKQPTNDSDWDPEWAQTGWAEIDGDVVTLHGFRNFDHALDGTMTERWETRTVHLSNLLGLDYFQDNFMENGLIAHPLFSFDFGPDGRVVLNITTRREKSESYSVFGGLYKMFELSYQFGDERDFVRVRTNVREEPVRLYRANFDKERVRQLFLDSVATQNALKERPRFYNLFSANCTTSIRAQTPVEKRAKFDYRMLVNGKLDELVYEREGFVTDGLSFEDLRKGAFINEAAQAVHDDPEFPSRIRDGRPGFGDR